MCIGIVPRLEGVLSLNWLDRQLKIVVLKAVSSKTTNKHSKFQPVAKKTFFFKKKAKAYTNFMHSLFLCKLLPLLPNVLRHYDDVPKGDQKI